MPTPDRAAIEADCRAVHAAAAACAELAGVTDGLIVLCAYGEQPGTGAELTTKIAHFKLADWQGIAATARKWAALPGYNVYRSLCAYRADLGPRQRGKADEALFVFGLAADLDADHGNAFDYGALPLPPSAVVRTSSIPAPNFQPTYLFDRPVTVDQARIMAKALKALVGDTGSGTGDPTHAWRPPGTLNNPKAAKLKRGRPLAPQLAVRVAGSGQLVSPGDLAKALGVDLKPSQATRAPASEFATVTAPAPTVAAPQAVAGNYDSGEIARYVDMLRYLNPESEHEWGELVGPAFHYESGGAQWGRDIWDAWSKQSPKFDPAEQQRRWDRCVIVHKRPRRFGTLVSIAERRGWDGSRALFGLVPMSQRPLHESSQRVMLAAAVMPTGELFHQAREAHVNYFANGTNKARTIRLLLAVSRFINWRRGFAWPGYSRLARRLGCSVDVVRKAIAELVKAGAIVASEPRNINGTGERGPSYALVPPAGMTWPDLIAWDRLTVGHDIETAYPDQLPPSPEKDRAVQNDTVEMDRAVQNGGGGMSKWTGLSMYYQNSTQGGGGEEQQQPTQADQTAQTAQPEQRGAATQSSVQQPQQRDLDGWLISAALPSWLFETIKLDTESRAVRNLIERLNIGRDAALKDSDLHELFDGLNWRLNKPLKNGKSSTAADHLKWAYEALVEAIGDVPANSRAFTAVQRTKVAKAKFKKPAQANTPAANWAASGHRYEDRDGVPFPQQPQRSSVYDGDPPF
jgi:Primase C terminal 2 (PriCT-2)/Helix-turn-helix domain